MPVCFCMNTGEFKMMFVIQYTYFIMVNDIWNERSANFVADTIEF